MRSETLTVCAVGAGQIFQQYHLPVIQGDPRLELVSVVDRSPEVRSALERELRLPVHDDLAAVEAADLCFVGTPAQVRQPVVTAALDKGMHVFCEKPFAYTSAEAAAMAGHAGERGLRIFVAHTRRCFPNVMLLRSFLAGGLLRPPLRIEIAEGGLYNWKSVAADRATAIPDDFGVLHDTGSHIFDLAGLLLADLGVPVDEVGVVRADIDNEISVNNARVELSWDRSGCPGSMGIRLSRTVDLANSIIVSGENLELATRSLFDTSLTARFATGDLIKISTTDNFPGLEGLADAFAAQWSAVLAGLGRTTQPDRRLNLEVESVLPGIGLLDRVVRAGRPRDTDELMVDGSLWKEAGDDSR